MATFCEDKEQMDKTVTCWAPVRRTRHQKIARSQGWLRDNRKRIEDGKEERGGEDKWTRRSRTRTCRRTAPAIL